MKIWWKIEKWKFVAIVQVSIVSRRPSQWKCSISSLLNIYSNSPVKWLKFSIQPQTRQSMLKYLTHKLRTHTIDDDTKVKPISHLTPLPTRVTILHCTSKSSDRCNLMGMKYYYYANLPKWRLCWSWSSVGRVSGGLNLHSMRMCVRHGWRWWLWGAAAAHFLYIITRTSNKAFGNDFSIYSQFIVVAVIRVVRGKGIEKNRIERWLIEKVKCTSRTLYVKWPLNVY